MEPPPCSRPLVSSEACLLSFGVTLAFVVLLEVASSRGSRSTTICSCTTATRSLFGMLPWASHGSSSGTRPPSLPLFAMLFVAVRSLVVVVCGPMLCPAVLRRLVLPLLLVLLRSRFRRPSCPRWRPPAFTRRSSAVGFALVWRVFSRFRLSRSRERWSPNVWLS